MSLIPALLCDRCEVSRYVSASIDDGRELMRAALEAGWLVQNTVTDHTHGRAVCPHCQFAGHGRDWA